MGLWNWKLKPIEGFRFLKKGFQASPSLTIPALGPIQTHQHWRERRSAEWGRGHREAKPVGPDFGYRQRLEDAAHSRIRAASKFFDEFKAKHGIPD